MMVDAAEARGVAAADIQTQSINLSQAFEDQHDAQGRYSGRKPAGFEASNTIAIRIRDLAKAGALAQDLIDKGANSFDGIAFSVEHPQPILDQLAAEAVTNARRQAEMVAQAAGVKLGARAARRAAVGGSVARTGVRADGAHGRAPVEGHAGRSRYRRPRRRDGGHFRDRPEVMSDARPRS